MNDEIKFNQEMLEQGQWTEEQKAFIKSTMEKIESALKEKHSEVADNLKLECHVPEEGVGAKIVASYAITDDIYLGEHASSKHLLEVFRDEPKGSKNLIKSLLNNHSILVYEKVIVRALGEQLNNLLKQNEQFVVKDEGTLTKNERVIIPSAFIPEGKILVHPNTLEKLKQDIKT